MSKYKKPLTDTQIAALGDEDIDFSDIPELRVTDDDFVIEFIPDEPPPRPKLRLVETPTED